MIPYYLSLNPFSDVLGGFETLMLYLIVLALIAILFAALIAGLSRSPGAFKYLALVIWLVLVILQLEGMNIAGMVLSLGGSL